jgi:alkylation response protein AidB-like acyl-CoA dehydrogenase
MTELMDRVTSVIEAVVRPVATEIDKSGVFPDAAIKAFGAADAGGIFMPRELGGQGGTMQDYARAMTLIAAACGSTSTVYMTQMHCAHPIHANGTPAQIARWVPPLSKGEAIGAIALTEPAAGSDVATMTTLAKKVPGGYEITGGKTFISNGDRADVIVLFATVDRSLGKDGITAFLIDTKAVTGFAPGLPMQKLGQKAASTVELSFEGCFVGDDAVLGEVGAGYQILLDSVLTSRISAAAQGVGFATGALDATCAELDARGLLSSHAREWQDLQFFLSRLYAEVSAGRALLERTAGLVDSGDPEAGVQVSVAKLYCTDLGVRVSNQCLRVIGERGDDKSLGVERCLRDAKITQIYDGTNQVQAMLIARELRHRAPATKEFAS